MKKGNFFITLCYIFITTIGAMTETDKQKGAFEAYYALGHDRSLIRLHQEWPKLAPKWAEEPPSLRTLKYWSKQQNWQNRIIMRDRAVTEGVEKKIIPDLVNKKAAMIAELQKVKQIALAGIGTAFAHDNKGELVKDKKGNPILLISVDKPSDLKHLGELFIRLTETELKALGEPDRAEVRVIEVKYDEDVERDRQTEAPASKATTDPEKPREA